MEKKIIGPALPPSFLKKDSDEDDVEETQESNSYGPQLPKQNLEESTEEQTPEIKFYGPQLPTKIQTDGTDNATSKINFCGPQLPNLNSSDNNVKKYGPQLPQDLNSKELIEEDENEDDIIGPLPAHLVASSSTQQALDERAEILKYKFCNNIPDDSDGPAKRESWMTELPPENAHIFGVGSRKFKANSNEKKPGRSLWTETPNSKRKNERETTNEVDCFEASAIDKRNEVMDEIVKRSKKHRKDGKALLEVHQETLKKKKLAEEEIGGSERRPFDRDVDLQVNRFDEAQKRSIISKAKLLDSRFKTGHSKYL